MLLVMFRASWAFGGPPRPRDRMRLDVPFSLKFADRHGMFVRSLGANLGHPQGREDNRASRVAAWAGELTFSSGVARGREDNRASRIAVRDARS